MKQRAILVLSLLAILAGALVGTLYALQVPSKGRVNCTALNVRTGPSTSYSIVGTISNGDVVEILETSGSWYLVNSGSFTSKYCYSSYIDVTDYAEVNDDEASKRPVPTLNHTNPKRPEVGPADLKALPRSDF
jgi:uncharacterized protein YgiM (DUF1202 family)